ncbi:MULTISPECIES: quinone-dependent dihydroorotate dehydrogenase [Empedobacter]|nr:MULTISPECIES: quinone-dependent dihydroorotate dehydrogenase [Empedobacter]MBW1617286.1 quinone-dependent dihydroorotate dehydrogenase [Empedobacter falsenii]MBY0065757.1 quinone-dependent dihydroorotate dehydrogenase [Empedobacter falsenii]MDH0673857.1 quinone-dependent dihydroorotate dehydrogenase [Empedobacter sp. GD03861]MDH1602683.1 quinone-dependent dihydroorotate dehydrogenase [Empedobacter sp. GD03739]
MYKQFKNILFQLQPEEAHHFVTRNLKNYAAFPGVGKLLDKFYQYNQPSLEREVFGIKFKNPIGLAAGFDKNAEYIEELNHFGFGFIEIGTVTPKPQPGNDAPRMFRLMEDEAIINRMGFNNKGVDFVVSKIRELKNRENYIIGGNIGKNKLTPNEDAVDDYIKCFNALFDYVDYFVVNVSSPNTPGLRDLQEKEPLLYILNYLQQYNNQNEKPKPILLKIAPDLTDSQLDDIIDIVLESKIAGVIATNTTISREGLKSDPEIVKETGGVSGKPLKNRSTEVIRYLSEKSNKAFPIIGVGGIHTAEDAKEKLEAGASLLQVYTGFIYEGPAVVKNICKGLVEGK